MFSSTEAMVSTVRGNRGRRLYAVPSIELVVRDFRKKSSNVCLFDFCYGIFWWVFGQKIVKIPTGFHWNFILGTQHIPIIHFNALQLRMHK